MSSVVLGRGRIVPALTAALLVLTTLLVPAPASAGEPAPGSKIIKRETLPDGSVRSTIRIGPIPALPHLGGGGHDHGVAPAHGPHEPMHGTHTTLVLPMIPPCVNCFVTSIQPDLTHLDGSKANYHTGVMLHHAVLFDRARSDVTCDGKALGLAGRRLFASGNERTGGALPAGHGVRMGLLPLTYTLVELMNMKPVPQPVFFDLTVTHVPADTPGMREVTPVWLDVNNCGNSQHAVPKGESHHRWDWTSTVSGTFKGAGGHLHDGGESISLSNVDTGAEMCESVAGYDTKPEYQGHIESMSTCLGDIGHVRKGETLRLDSTYHSHYATDDAMSIMVAYVAE